MPEQEVSLPPARWFGSIVAIIAITNIAILFNIPILRQTSAFFFLTAFPGFLILTILKLNKLGSVEKIVLSVGLSISFTMLFGLIINFLLLTLGYKEPLSTLSLLISFNIATLALAIVAYLRNKNITFPFSNLELTTKEKMLLIVPSLFPLLSIGGMRLMNETDNNLLLMFLLFLIPAYVIFIAFYHSKVSERLYPAMIFLIGISLLLMLSLRGNHVTGSDSLESYYVFQTTLDKMHWSVTTPTLVGGCLSISLLPSIYQIFLDTNQEYLFKVLNSLLFSISPLLVYVIAKKYIGSFYAFLTSFFFMSQFCFLWTISLCQTSIAILFFALAIMVLFHDSINDFAKRLFFLIFAISCIVSHYSTSYIFFFLLLLTWIGMQIMYWIHLGGRKRLALSKSATAGSNLNDLLPGGGPAGSNARDSRPVANNVSQSHFKKGISITSTFLVFVMLFLWHSSITGAAFNNAIEFVYRTLISLHQSFLVEAKGSEVVGAFGQSDLPAIPQQLRFIFSWLTVLFVAIGGLSIAARYKSAVSYPDSRHIKMNSLHSKFEMEYFVLSAACGIIVGSAVALPYVSVGYSMERTYFQTLAVLSPYFAICGIMIARWLRVKPYLVMLLVLIPFFMCITGTMYQLFRVPAAMALNSAGTEYEHMYIQDRESYAAKWLAENAEGGEFIHTDYGQGPRILASQGKIPMSRVRGSLIADYRQGKDISGYLYLFYPDVVKGEAALSSYAKMDIVPLPDMLASRNKVYTAGLTEIYR